MLNIDKVISVCIVVLLIGLAGLVYIGVSNPSWSPFIEGPGNINNVSVENGIIDLTNVESLRYKGTLLAMASYDSYILEDGEQRLVEMIEFGISSDFDGELNNSNKIENADILFDANLSFIEDVEERRAVIGIKFIDDDAYLKMDSSNDFFLDDYQEVLGDKWLKIGKEFFAEQSSVMSLGSLALLRNPFKSIKDSVAILEGKKIFIIKEYLGIDKVAGQNSGHYSVSIDKEALKVIIREYTVLYLDSIAPMIGFSPEDALDELTELFNNMIDGLWNAIGGIDLEVWLDQQGLLTKIKFDRKFTKKELDDGKFLGMDGDVFNLNFEIEFSDFDKKVDIETPEDYMDIDELMAPTEGRIVNKAKDARIISSLAQSRTVMTFINANDGDYDNFNCQHPEEKALCEEVNASGGEMNIAKDKALDSGASCIYSKLTQQENYWYCADSTGMAGFTAVNPGSVGYCVNGISAVCPQVSN